MDKEAKRAALALLIRGQITVPEAARLAGVSRFTICRWVAGRREKFDQTRNHRIAKLWRREIARPPRRG